MSSTTLAEIGCLENLWINLKNNNRLYGLNKLLSVVVSLGCALITISLRANIKKGHTPCDAVDYKFLFWMLFVYYSLHALGELHEVYLVMYNTNKGIVGLLFDMNYFAGLYITWRVIKAVYDSPECSESSPDMYKWLVFQTIVFYSVVGVYLLLTLCQWRINSKVTKRRSKFNDEDDD